MPKREDFHETNIDGIGVVSDWNGDEIEVNYSLTSVPEGYLADSGCDDDSNDRDGRFTGVVTPINTEQTLLLCPSDLSIDGGRKLEVTIYRMDVLTSRYDFITSSHMPVG